MTNPNLTKSIVGTSHLQNYQDFLKNTDFYEAIGTPTQTTDFTQNFDKWHEYYNEIPLYAEIIDTLAVWTIGKGYEGKEEELKKIENFTGWGKDDTISIFENLLRVALNCGDSMAEIIKDNEQIINLKPLNPGKIKVKVTKKGILKEYVQEVNGVSNVFKPEEIFHLCWNRFADEIHGKPYAQRVEPIIKQIKQLQEDLGVRFHRVVKPVRLFEANTDEQKTLLEVETLLRKAYENCEFIIIPKGTLEAKDISKIPDAMDVLKYLEELWRSLIVSCGCPEIILGWSRGSTEASGKIVYLAFQQRIERIQKFIEEQIKKQLGVNIKFLFPADLMEAQAVGVAQGLQSSQQEEFISSPASFKKDGNLNAVREEDISI